MLKLNKEIVSLGRSELKFCPQIFNDKNNLTKVIN